MISIWIFWIILIAFLIVNAMISETAFALIMAILSFALPVIFILLNRINTKILLDINIPERCEKNQKIKGLATLKNRSFLTYRSVKISLEFKNLLTGEEIIQSIKSNLFSRNKCGFEFQFKSHLCGTISISCGKIKLYDFFGLTYKTVYFDESFKTIIMPDIFPIRINMKDKDAGYSESFSYADGVGNDLSEVYDFREYVNGDNPRQIQWKLSQKHRDLIVKEGSKPASQSVALAMLNGENSKIENCSAMAEAFVSISQSLCENGVDHKILLNSHNSLQASLYDISGEEDLVSVIPKILSSKKVRDCKDFFENAKDLECEHIVCVTCNSDIADMSEEYCTSVFLAGESQNTAIMSFSSEFMEQELFEIDI